MEQKHTAFTFECHFAVAEFGEEYVTVEADSKDEALLKIDEWCEQNYCISSKSPGFPRPSLVHSSVLIKKNQIGKAKIWTNRLW